MVHVKLIKWYDISLILGHLKLQDKDKKKTFLKMADMTYSK